MNESSELVANLPAIILLSFWWAVVSALDRRLSRDKSQKAQQQVPASGAQLDRHDRPDPRFEALRAVDPAFDLQTFLAGAARAYEEIMNLYANADLEALRPLISAEVHKAFSDVRTAHVQRGEALVFAYVGLASSEIEFVAVDGNQAEIAVRFRAEIVSAVLSATGVVVSGEPSAVKGTDEVWTFARQLGSGDVNWILVATCQD
ncbi:MAG: Tim44/TimA family putative adaptor protein [Mesorhizobium sp.]|nr:Tim44/TimA family putative adaptor protein [Mesorhizobium sp.]MCO5163976.1 Tim44/TimA family putative adaptor protein [Mesorhizobium sp.]